MKETLARVVRDAGQFVEQLPLTVLQEKEGVGNVQLRADIESQALLVKEIMSHFPHIQIIAEENGLEKIPHDLSGTFAIIDALDGSTNRSVGLPLWGISVGIVQNREIVAGAMYDRLSGKVFVAESGKGAFLDGERMHPLPDHPLRRAIVVTSPGYDFERDWVPNNRRANEAMRRGGAQIRIFGSSVCDLAMLAEGNIHVYTEETIKPWDIAGGIAVVRELGCVATTYSGELDIFHPMGVVIGVPTAVREFIELTKHIR
ncbi:MAG: inositol monophosphatase [bacterium]|nr:inositol monophosphatase [bacterium]